MIIGAFVREMKKHICGEWGEMEGGDLAKRGGIGHGNRLNWRNNNISEYILFKNKYLQKRVLMIFGQ